MHVHRVATVYDPDLDALPAEFRSVLTEQDVQAIRKGPEFFADLVDSNAPKWLRKVLENCADSNYVLQFVAVDEEPYRPYFRFLWQGEPAISLPRPQPVRADVPAFLRQIYGVIGSFRENGFDEAGGLHSGDELAPLSETGMWVEPGGSIDPIMTVPFLETFSGNQLCYLPNGGGAWLKDCTLHRVKNLEREVAAYFEALLKGTRI
jgi:hypothetical protein